MSPMTATPRHLLFKLMVHEADWERGHPYPDEAQIAQELAIKVGPLRALAAELERQGHLEPLIDGEPPRLKPGKVWPHRGPVFRTRREEGDR